MSLGYLGMMPFWTVAAFALSPDKAITQYTHQVWGIEQGLPENSAQAILQTRDGYLWVGTGHGLARFDGIRFTVFDTSNTSGLRDNSVTALHQDRRSNLWIGTGGGLSVLHDGQVLRSWPATVRWPIVLATFAWTGPPQIGSGTFVLTDVTLYELPGPILLQKGKTYSLSLQVESEARTACGYGATDKPKNAATASLKNDDQCAPVANSVKWRSDDSGFQFGGAVSGSASGSCVCDLSCGGSDLYCVSTQAVDDYRVRVPSQ